MARKRKYTPRETNYLLLCGQVTGEPEQIKYKDNVKSVFNVICNDDNQTYTCIYWNGPLPQTGETITAKGSIKNGVFLVLSMLRNYTLI